MKDNKPGNYLSERKFVSHKLIRCKNNVVKFEKLISRCYNMYCMESAKRIILVVISILFISACEQDPWSYDEPIPRQENYVVYGVVMRGDSPAVLYSVYLYIMDPRYIRDQTEFECKTDYRGKYKFIVTNKDWDGYNYQLYTGGKKYYGRIKFGQIDRVDFHL